MQTNRTAIHLSPLCSTSIPQFGPTTSTSNPLARQRPLSTTHAAQFKPPLWLSTKHGKRRNQPKNSSPRSYCRHAMRAYRGQKSARHWVFRLNRPTNAGQGVCAPTIDDLTTSGPAAGSQSATLSAVSPRQMAPRIASAAVSPLSTAPSMNGASHSWLHWRALLTRLFSSRLTGAALRFVSRSAAVPRGWRGLRPLQVPRATPDEAARDRVSGVVGGRAAGPAPAARGRPAPR